MLLDKLFGQGFFHGAGKVVEDSLQAQPDSGGGVLANLPGTRDPQVARASRGR